MFIQWIGSGLLILFTFGTLFVALSTYSDITKLLGCEQEYQKKEIQNLVSVGRKCYRNEFMDILLVVVYNYELYSSIPTLQRMYQRAFPSIVFCGRDKDFPGRVNISLDIMFGVFGYNCLTKAIERYPEYEGYLYINDDMIVNFWNFVNLDRNRIWQGALITNGAPMFSDLPTDKIVSRWIWLNTTLGRRACISAYKQIHRTYSKQQFAKIESNLLHNGNGVIYCSRGWSDLFYIPRIHAKSYADLANIFYDKKVFLEIAVTTIIRMLDKVENTVKLGGTYLPDFGASDSRAFWTSYSTDVKFVHPFKLHVNEYKKMNYAILNNWVLKHIDKLTNCKEEQRFDR